MEKKTRKIIQKKGKYFTETERHSLIQEMLKNNWTKQYAWELYTGEPEERGQLLRWVRKLGYVGKIQNKKFVSKRSILKFEIKSGTMADKSNEEQESFEMLQLKKRIAELEKKLKDEEMKAIAWQTMVDIAEKEFNIPIKKKFNTKPSEK